MACEIKVPTESTATFSEPKVASAVLQFVIHQMQVSNLEHPEA